jgi:hypothetical protein
LFPFRRTEYSKSSPWKLKISNTSHAGGGTYENSDSSTVNCDGAGHKNNGDNDNSRHYFGEDEGNAERNFAIIF